MILWYRQSSEGEGEVEAERVRPASAVMSLSLPCVTFIFSSLCIGFFKDMRDFQGFLLPCNHSQKATDEARKPTWLLPLSAMVQIPKSRSNLLTFLFGEPALHIPVHKFYLPGAHTPIHVTMICRNNHRCAYGVVDSLLWKRWV